MDMRVLGTWLTIGFLLWMIGYWLQLRFKPPLEILRQADSQGLTLTVSPPKWVQQLCGLKGLRREHWETTALMIQLIGSFVIIWSLPISLVPSEWSVLLQFLSIGFAMMLAGTLIRRWKRSPK